MRPPQVVLYVENGMTGGGSAESLMQLLAVLDRSKFIPVVVFSSSTPYVARVAAIGVETMVLDHWYVSRASGRLRSLATKIASIAIVYGARWLPLASLWLELAITASLRRRLRVVMLDRRVSIVHSNNNPHRDLWVIAAAAECDIPCVSHLRSFHSMGFSSQRSAFVNQRSAAFIAYSRSVAKHWISNGLDASRISVIHNAIGKMSRKPTNLESEFGIPVSSQVVAIVGRIIPERRHDLLIKALPRIRAKIPSLRLLVVGGAGSREERFLRQLVEDANLNDVVILAGHRRDAQEIIAAADVIVLPYSIEPFGRTVLEAWQLGTPVVLSNVGHVSDIVEDRETALLFVSGDAGSLADRVVEVLSDTVLAKRLVRKGLAACQDRFSIEAQRDEIQALYSRILDSAGTAILQQ